MTARTMAWILATLASLALFGLGLYELLYGGPYLAVLWFVLGGAMLLVVLWALMT